MKNTKPQKAAKVISLILATILVLGMFSAVQAEEVVIRQSRVTLIVGDTFDLSIGNASEGATWTTDNAEIATVEDGVVTAVALGEAVVTAALNGGEYKCHVEVAPKKEISMSQTYAVLGAGSGLQLKLEGAKGRTTWTSSDKNIASVNMNGKVTTRASGTVTVTARNNEKNYTCVLFVRPAIKASEKSVVVDAGSEKTINVISMNEKTRISFSADNKNAVQVRTGKRAGNVTPMVIAGKKAGQATLTIKNNLTKETVKIQVTVNQAATDPTKQNEGTSAVADKRPVYAQPAPEQPASEQPTSDKPEDATGHIITVKPDSPENPEEQKPAPEKATENNPVETKPETESQKPAVSEETTKQEEQKQNKEEKPTETKPETKPQNTEETKAETKPDGETASAGQNTGTEKPDSGNGKQEDTKPAAEQYTITYSEETVDIPYETETRYLPTEYKGTEYVARNGQKGQKTVKYEIKKDSSGKQVSKTVVTETITKNPVSEVYVIGTFEPTVTVEVVSADPTGMTGERNSDIDQRCEDQAFWMAENVVQHSYTGGGDPGYTESVGGWGSLEDAIAGTEAHGGSAVNHSDQYGFGVVKKTETLPDGNTKETYYAVSQGQSGDYNPFEDPHYAWVQEGLDGPIREVVEVYHGDP